METKVCTKCGIEKEIVEFHKSKRHKDGHRSICKVCRVDESAIYGKEHKLKSNKKYYEKHKTKILIKRQAYYNKNKDSILEKNLIYRKNNRESIAKKKMEYLKTEKGKAVRQSINYNRRVQKNKNSSVTSLQLIELKNKSNNKCYWCGCKVSDKYHFDHYVPLAKGGENTIDNLVLSCPACNLKKCDKDPHKFAMKLGRLL